VLTEPFLYIPIKTIHITINKYIKTYIQVRIRIFNSKMDPWSIIAVHWIIYDGINNNAKLKHTMFIPLARLDMCL